MRGPTRRIRGRSSRAAAVGMCGAAFAALVLPGPTYAGPAVDSACDRLEPGGLGGLVAEDRLIEISGLAASWRHDGVLWAHNDSGGAPEVYALREDGTSLGAHPVQGATAIDWEDMASGPGPDGTGGFLYVGDIGDNDSARPSVTVYRIPEPVAVPAPPGATLEGAEAIELVYPDGPSDAEALLVDPRTGDLVIVTKSFLGASRVLSAPVETLVPGTPVRMVDAGGRSVPLAPSEGEGLPGTIVTGGDVSADGSLVVLRTYRSVLVFSRADDQTLAEALLAEPCFGPQQEEPQGEAVAFTHDGTAYVTASEGTNVPIHRIAITEPTPPTTTTIADPSDDDPPSDDGDDPITIGAALVGAALVLVVLGRGVLWWSRRRRGSSAG